MSTPYHPAPDRFDRMRYRPTGRWGLKLPVISLGLWHNFGGVDPFENGRSILRRAYDLGITHFDLANNYGPPPGSAEENFGRIYARDFKAHRDDLVISTKAGYTMQPGPYGDGGSRKYLLSSLDASLKRMGLDHVDIFYYHRHDRTTPLEETMSALDRAVRSGKALYAGISNLDPQATREAAALLKQLGTPLLIHQFAWNIFERNRAAGLHEAIEEVGAGGIVFVPLAQGQLTDKYVAGIPEGSRASKSHSFLKASAISDRRMAQIKDLNDLAQQRGQKLAHMALGWVLRDPRVTSALIGASRPEQIDDCMAALNSPPFDEETLKKIDAISLTE